MGRGLLLWLVGVPIPYSSVAVLRPLNIPAAVCVIEALVQTRCGPSPSAAGSFLERGSWRSVQNPAAP